MLKTETAQIVNPKNWTFTKPQKGIFTADAVLNAYLKGKKEGIELSQKLTINKLKTNIDKAGKNTIEIIEFMKGLKINPKSAYLKILSWDSLEVIILVSEKDFLSKKFLKIYDEIANFENKYNNDLYNINFRFNDQEEAFDLSQLISEGFILKHNEF